MRFADTIVAQLPALVPGHRGRVVEPLVSLDYAAELALKNQALSEFWRHHRLPLAPAAIVPAPRPRHYRTTTRRHVILNRGRLELTAGHGDVPAARGRPAKPSQLEPPEHAALYAFLGERLQEAHYRPLVSVLTYLIIRGSYRERALLFNVCRLDGPIVRKLKRLAEILPEFDPGLVSSFAFVDPTRSTYYLDSAPVAAGLKLKRLHGPETLRLDFAGHRYRFYPTGFSQVNEAMVPVLLETVREFLQPCPDQHLVDLYCGYGLFTHYLAGSYTHALGLDLAPESIAAAIDNARYHPAANRVSFRAVAIDVAACRRLLPAAGSRREVLLCDPPRQGLPLPLIGYLASRGPERVVQACCGIDEVPAQIRAWEAAGYRLLGNRPLDLFAGTPHLETILGFAPAEAAAGAPGSPSRRPPDPAPPPGSPSRRPPDPAPPLRAPARGRRPAPRQVPGRS